MISVNTYVVHLPLAGFPIPQELLSTLPDALQSKIHSKAEQADSCRTLIAYFLPRYVLSLSPYSIPFNTAHKTAEGGKPYIPDSGIEYNLSHDGQYVLLGISTIPIGVDVMHYELDYWPDCTPAELLTTLEDHMTELEKTRFSLLDKQEGGRYLIRLWACKEGISKAIGKGLRADLSKFEIREKEAKEWQVWVEERKSDWIVKEVHLEEGYFAVIVVETAKEVQATATQVWEWDELLRLTKDALPIAESRAEQDTSA